MKTLIKQFVPFPVGVKIRGGVQKFLGYYYKGNQYECPFCGEQFRQMLDGGINQPASTEKQIIGAGRRKNIVCPRCFSTDRDRLLYFFLKNETQVFTQPCHILHIAPEGSIRYLLTQQHKVSYVSGDKFEKGYRGYYYDRMTKQLDVTNLPFEDNTFDGVICNHVLEHIADDRAAIMQIYRVLRKGGWAILQVPVSAILEFTYEPTTYSEEERNKLFGQYDHLRIYGQDYSKRLEEAGFRVEIHNPQRHGWELDIKRYAINPKEDVYFAIK